jgi:hypothetical protein
MLLMFYGTLMFALEYARAARWLQRWFIVAPTQRNV